MKFKHIFWLALAGLAFFFFWQGRSQTPELVVIDGQTMGTYYQVKLVVPQGQYLEVSELKHSLDATLAEVNAQMSTYDPNSELSEFNRGPANTPFVMSSGLSTVIDEAIRLGEMTKGALDVTVGPLVNLWGFGPQARPETMPSEQTINQAKQRTGLDKLLVTDLGLLKSQTDLYVDLSAIAKGYGVDQLASQLAMRGVSNYLVDIGGELRMRGLNAKGVPWRIAVEKPTPGNRAVQQIIEPGENGVATSGDYRNYFEENGVRYSHTIDPGTGRPIGHTLASVTVIHPSAMTADGLATALMVLGPERGMQLSEELGLAVFMVVKKDDEFGELSSLAFKQYLMD